TVRDHARADADEVPPRLGAVRSQGQVQAVQQHAQVPLQLWELSGGVRPNGTAGGSGSIDRHLAGNRRRLHRGCVVHQAARAGVQHNGAGFVGKCVWRSQHAADRGGQESSHLDEVHGVRSGDQLYSGRELQHVRLPDFATDAQLDSSPDDHLLIPTLNNENINMRYINFFSDGRNLIMLTSLVALATSVACNTEELLKVTDPDVARPEALQGAAALPTLRAGAIGNFGVAYNGGAADVEQVHLSGLLSDEFINTETFPTRIEIDQRPISISNTSLANTGQGGTFFDLTRARASADQAIAAYGKFAQTRADSTGFPEVLGLSGFSYILF